MAAENKILRCNSCGARNRVPLEKINANPVCGKCKTPLPSAATGPVVVTDATFNGQVAAFPGPVLLDCWAPWCGPCKMMAPVLDQLAAEFAGRVKIAKLNVDENQQTASRFNIMSIPTLMLFNNGRLVKSIPGAVPKPEIARELNALAGGG